VLSIDALCEAESESWVYKGHTLLDEGEGVAPTRTLVHLSRGGADATVVREFDLATWSFVQAAEGRIELPVAKSNVDWKSRDVLLVGTDFGPGSLTDSGYPRTVREWRRGTPLGESVQVYASYSCSDHRHARDRPSRHSMPIVRWGRFPTISPKFSGGVGGRGTAVAPRVRLWRPPASRILIIILYFPDI
jgi:prolyl oligopeptidase PreP (S9A serine peptidase family)